VLEGGQALEQGEAVRESYAYPPVIASGPALGAAADVGSIWVSSFQSFHDVTVKKRRRGATQPAPGA
jgi:hypothetical protein